MTFHLVLLMPDASEVVEEFPAVPACGGMVRLDDKMHPVTQVVWEQRQRLNGPTHLTEWWPIVCLGEAP